MDPGGYGVSMITSQNGWPASADKAAIDVVYVSIPLSGGRVRHANIARKAVPALVEFVQWWDRTVEPVSEIGSHNYREIRGQEGTGNVSNHGSGTALDLNPALHPLGAVGTVPAAVRPMITAKAAELGLRWGGDYRHRKDEMHVEVASTLDQWLARAQSAATAAAGVAGAALAWLLPGGGLAVDPSILLWKVIR